VPVLYGSARSARRGGGARLPQRINLAAAGKAPLSRILTFAEERGWRRLRMLSSAGGNYNRDYHAQTSEGHQRPMLNVFQRHGETIRHFWGSELLYQPTPDRIPVTSAPSNRSGTSTTSLPPGAELTGMSS
jgi:predicted dithiol-disulfide oxidoreductase (DUF899 family)